MDDGGAPDVVRAAGGVPWRRSADGGVEVLVVHRPRYDDWSFPKGKLDPGESWEQAAVRETYEEAGIVAVLGVELPPTTYRDRFDRPKRVRYWAMTVAVDAGASGSDDEVDQRRWLDVHTAASVLTYDRDREVLARIVAIVSEGG